MRRGAEPEVPIGDNRVGHHATVAENEAVKEASTLLQLSVSNPPDPIVGGIRILRDVARAAALFDDVAVEILLRRAQPARRGEGVVLLDRSARIPPSDEVLDRLDGDRVAERGALHDQVLALEGRFLRVVCHEAAAGKLVGRDVELAKARARVDLGQCRRSGIGGIVVPTVAVEAEVGDELRLEAVEVGRRSARRVESEVAAGEHKELDDAGRPLPFHRSVYHAHSRPWIGAIGRKVGVAGVLVEQPVIRHVCRDGAVAALQKIHIAAGAQIVEVEVRRAHGVGWDAVNVEGEAVLGPPGAEGCALAVRIDRAVIAVGLSQIAFAFENQKGIRGGRVGFAQNHQLAGLVRLRWPERLAGGNRGACVDDVLANGTPGTSSSSTVPA